LRRAATSDFFNRIGQQRTNVRDRGESALLSAADIINPKPHPSEIAFTSKCRHEFNTADLAPMFREGLPGF
jgi:hypothetical protein